MVDKAAEQAEGKAATELEAGLVRVMVPGKAALAEGDLVKVEQVVGPVPGMGVKVLVVRQVGAIPRP